MENKLENIDKLFAEKLGSLTATPTDMAWEAIASELPSNKNNSIYRTIAATLVFLITAAFAWQIILNKQNTNSFEIAAVPVKANYPQQLPITLPVIVNTTTVVYIHDVPTATTTSKPYRNETPKIREANLSRATNIQPLAINPAQAPTIDIAALDNPINHYEQHDAVTIIYKKGESKTPKLDKTKQFLKQVSRGERPLIDFNKFSNNLLARRETNNNSK